MNHSCGERGSRVERQRLFSGGTSLSSGHAKLYGENSRGSPSALTPSQPWDPAGLGRQQWGTSVQGKREGDFWHAEEKLRVAAAPVQLEQAAAVDALPCSLRAVECRQVAGTEEERRCALSTHRTAPGVPQDQPLGLVWEGVHR